MTSKEVIVDRRKKTFDQYLVLFWYREVFALWVGYIVRVLLRRDEYRLRDKAL